MPSVVDLSSNSSVRMLSVNPDNIACAYLANLYIPIFDIAKSKVIHKYEVANQIAGLHFSNEKKHVFYAIDDSFGLHIFDTRKESKKKVRLNPEFENHNVVATAHAGHFIAVASAEFGGGILDVRGSRGRREQQRPHVISFYDVRFPTHPLTSFYKNCNAEIVSMEYYSNGYDLIVGDRSGLVKVYDCRRRDEDNALRWRRWAKGPISKVGVINKRLVYSVSDKSEGLMVLDNKGKDEILFGYANSEDDMPMVKHSNAYYKKPEWLAGFVKGIDDTRPIVAVHGVEKKNFISLTAMNADGIRESAPLLSYAGHVGDVKCMTNTPELLLTGGEDGKVIIQSINFQSSRFGNDNIEHYRLTLNRGNLAEREDKGELEDDSVTSDEDSEQAKSSKPSTSFASKPSTSSSVKPSTSSSSPKKEKSDKKEHKVEKKEKESSDGKKSKDSKDRKEGTSSSKEHKDGAKSSKSQKEEVKPSKHPKDESKPSKHPKDESKPSKHPKDESKPSKHPKDESKSSNERKDESKSSKGHKEETKHSKEEKHRDKSSKDSKPSKEEKPSSSEKHKEVKEAKSSKDNKESNGHKERKEQKDHKRPSDHRDSKHDLDSKKFKESKEYKESKESKESKDSQHKKDAKVSAAPSSSIAAPSLAPTTSGPLAPITPAQLATTLSASVVPKASTPVASSSHGHQSSSRRHETEEERRARKEKRRLEELAKAQSRAKDREGKPFDEEREKRRLAKLAETPEQRAERKQKAREERARLAEAESKKRPATDEAGPGPSSEAKRPKMQ